MLSNKNINMGGTMTETDTSFSETETSFIDISGTFVAEEDNSWKDKLGISEHGVAWISFIKRILVGLIIYHFLK